MTTFNYLAISKIASLKFKNYSYLLTLKKENGLIFGEKLTFGYLQNITSLGAKRGWFISKYSVCEKDFDKYFTLEIGAKKAKI